MGYAKIDKNKIQPSPALAALTGFLSGLNTKKKELQDREDAQNKQAVDWYKAVQEQGIKERETQVKERGATTAEQVASTDFDYKTSLISKATEDINTSRATETRTKEKWLIDKVPLEAQSNPNHPFNKAKLAIRKAELWNQALNDIKKQEELDKLKYGVGYVDTGSYRREQEVQLEFKIKEIDAQNIAKYTPSIQTNKGVVSPAQLQQDIETTGQLLVEGERAKTQKAIASMGISADVNLEGVKQKGRKELEILKGGTESNDPKVRNFLSIQKSNQGFFGTVLTSPNKIVDDLTAKYMGDRSQMEMSAWNELTKEQQKGLTEPVPVGLSKRAKGGYLWGKVGAKPTEMLTGSDLINFRQFTTREAREDMLSKYPNKNEALAHLIDLGVTEVAGQSIVDEVYKKK